MMDYETFLRRLNKINKNYYHKSRELIGTYKKGYIILHVDSSPKDPFLPPGRMRIRLPFSKLGYPEKFKQEPLSILLAHFISSVLSELNSKFFRIYRPTNIIIKRTNCLVGKSVEIRFDYHIPSKSRHIMSNEMKDLMNKIFEKIEELKYKNVMKSKLKPIFEEMVRTYEDQLELRRRMEKEEIAGFVADGSIIPRKKFTRQKMDNAIPFKTPKGFETVLEGKHREFTGLAIYKGKTTLITGSNFQGKSTLLFGLSTGFYNHIAGDGREFVLSEELPLANKESGRIVNNCDVSLFLKDGEKINTLSASGSISQMANMSEILRFGKGFMLDEDESAVNFLIKSGISYVKSDRIIPFSEVSEKLPYTQILAAGALKEMEEIADDIIVLENFVPVKIIRGEKRKGVDKKEIKSYKIERVRKFEVKEANKSTIRFKSSDVSLLGPIKPTIYERAQVYLISDLINLVEPGLTPEENARKIMEKVDKIMKESISKNYSMITTYQLYYVINRLPFIK